MQSSAFLVLLLFHPIIAGLGSSRVKTNALYRADFKE